MNKIQGISLLLLLCIVSACGGTAKPSPQNTDKNLVTTVVAVTLDAIPSSTVIPVSSARAPTLPKPVYEFRLRQFDPASIFFGEKIAYPEELTSILDSNIIPLGCSHRYNRKMMEPVFKDQPTPTREPEISKEYIYTDPITQATAGISDPLMRAFLNNADASAQSQAERSNLPISYIFYCNIDDENSIVFYGMGPCGGGCIGNEHISLGKSDGSLTFFAKGVASDLAYGVCSPLLLTTQQVLYMQCVGEFARIIRKINLQDASISDVFKCFFGTSTSTDEFPIVCE